MNCIQCEKLIVGRPDKKFCNDSCRSKWHNQNKRPQTNHIRNMNNLLIKNRNILEKLFPSATKRQLIDNGFNFKYHTNTYTSKNGYFYRFVYDYGFVEVDESVTIVKL